MSSPVGARAPRSAHRLRCLAGWPAVAVVVVAASCAGPDGSTGTLPPPPPVVDVTMDDYRFDLDRPVPAGRVVFRMLNAGEVSHNLVLFPLADDVPPIDEQLRGHDRMVVAPFASIRGRAPGQTATFAVDLEPGKRYAVICSLLTRDRQSHALKGMSAEFRAGADPPTG